MLVHIGFGPGEVLSPEQRRQIVQSCGIPDEVSYQVNLSTDDTPKRAEPGFVVDADERVIGVLAGSGYQKVEKAVTSWGLKAWSQRISAN